MANCTGCPYRWHDSNCEYCSKKGDEVIDYKNYSKDTCSYYNEYEASRKSNSSQSHSSAGSSGGCYVATAVYGSYDCPQVWTLRRYRDFTLAQSRHGRAFIRTYYAISPTLVKWFGNTAWFKRMWKSKLDSMVKKLQSEGVEDSPYEDKNY